MCGIWAVFGSDHEVAMECQACNKIGHRGPDSFRMENVNHYRNCCFGFHRLAIVDDLRGMQPIRLHGLPHLWLCYNGEIYNYRALEKEFDFKYETDCDGEAILHLYNRGGVEFAAQHLDGVFAFIILDVANRKVHLGRDTVGIRPAFRFVTPSGFLAVCSEVKGIMGLLPEDSSVEVEPLAPGHYETYDLQPSGKVSLYERGRFHKIGQPPAYKTPESPIDDDKVHDNIRLLLKTAVKKRMMSDRRIGCMLSGGLDSSLIAALVVECAKEMNLSYPIQTFSTGMEGSPDLKAARVVSKHLGTEHHEVVFTPEQGIEILKPLIYHLESYDITTVRASVGMYLVSKYISELKDGSVVIFSGEGADELAQGYIYFHKSPSPTDGDNESHRLLNDLYMFDVLRADRTTAAHGLELRVPLLDHRFTSYYLSLSPELRQPREGIEKYTLRKAFDGTELIPQEILWRGKEAFSDGVSSTKASWHEILQRYVDECVNDCDVEQSQKLYPFNPPRTKEALHYRRLFDEYYPGHASLIKYFWMPKWTETDDPSARTLKHYKQ